MRTIKIKQESNKLANLIVHYVDHHHSYIANRERSIYLRENARNNRVKLETGGTTIGYIKFHESRKVNPLNFSLIVTRMGDELLRSDSVGTPATRLRMWIEEVKALNEMEYQIDYGEGFDKQDWTLTYVPDKRTWLPKDFRAKAHLSRTKENRNG